MEIFANIGLSLNERRDMQSIFCVQWGGVFSGIFSIEIASTDLSWRDRLLDFLLHHAISLQDFQDLIDSHKTRFLTMEQKNAKKLYEPWPVVEKEFIAWYAKLNKIKKDEPLTLEMDLEYGFDDYEYGRSYNFSLSNLNQDPQKKWSVLSAIIEGEPKFKRLADNRKYSETIGSIIQEAETEDFTQPSIAWLSGCLDVIDKIKEYLLIAVIKNFEEWVARTMVQERQEAILKKCNNIAYDNHTELSAIRSCSAYQQEFGSRILCD